jgi:hypothetical protein
VGSMDRVMLGSYAPMDLELTGQAH